MTTKRGETVSIPEAARRLGVSAWAAYRSIQRGDFPLPVIRVGKRVLVARAALDELLSARAGDGPRDAA